MGCVPENRFGLLLWKNWLLQKRKVVLTVFEVLIPVAVSLLLLLIRQTTEQTKVSEPTTWAPFNVSGLPEALDRPNGNWAVAYTPNNTVVWRVMQRVSVFMDVQLSSKYLK